MPVISGHLKYNTGPILVGIALAIWVAGTTASAQTMPDSKTPQANSIERSCALTMGFEPASTEYAACVTSLRHSAAVNENMQNLKQQRLTCIGQGLAIGTPDFANCVANRPDAGGVDSLEATKESKACEGLGLAPGDPGYSNCVTSLRSATVSDPASYALSK